VPLVVHADGPRALHHHCVHGSGELRRIFILRLSTGLTPSATSACDRVTLAPGSSLLRTRSLSSTKETFWLESLPQKERFLPQNAFVIGSAITACAMAVRSRIARLLPIAETGRRALGAAERTLITAHRRGAVAAAASVLALWISIASRHCT
jgi:hypothetical protein